MSDYAITVNDHEYHTALYYQELFLTEGKSYDNFYCPFCHIELCANLIYKVGKKSPYFSARWGGHKFDCDGTPIFIVTPVKKKYQSHYALRDAGFPQMLTERPKPRIVISPLFKPRLNEISSRDVEDSRKAAGSLGVSTPQTHLLRSIVLSCKRAISNVYDEAKNKGWSVAIRKIEIKNTLSLMPLRLDDNTNYGEAFRKPDYLRLNNRRIYQAEGTVNFQGGQLFITTPMTFNSVTCKFKVIVGKPIVSAGSPLSHSDILDNLTQKIGTSVSWYAYGLPKKVGQDFHLAIDNLDYLYFKA